MILELVYYLVFKEHSGKVVSGRKRLESFFRKHLITHFRNLQMGPFTQNLEARSKKEFYKIHNQ